MLGQPLPSPSQSTFFTVHPAWCAPNPNVDRSAPPRPAKRKAAKKKVTKKPAKKR